MAAPRSARSLAGAIEAFALAEGTDPARVVTGELVWRPVEVGPALTLDVPESLCGFD